MRLTKTGATMGTVAYLSPEQVQRIDADHRTDIWSLGVVFYEMLTGKLPFEGDYEQAVMYAIVNMEPEAVRSLKSEVPVALESIVHKCLAKEPEERHQTILELQNDLKLLQHGEPQKIPRKIAVSTPKKLRKKKRVLWTVAPAVFAAAVAIWFYFFSPFLKPALPPMKTIPFTSLPGMESWPAFSPDGHQIAFEWKDDIYVQLIGTDTPLRLTEAPELDFSPTWSADGRYLAFGRKYTDTTDAFMGAIFIMPALGGTERKLCSVRWDL
jgi:serine/threonine protein kinase